MLEFEAPLVDLEKKIAELKAINDSGEIDFSSEIRELEIKNQQLKSTVYKDLSPWQMTLVARHPKRPIFEDYLKTIFTDTIELHGDRYFAEDYAIWCGFAKINDEKIVLIGQQKGRNVEDNIKRNFAYAHPEGYRKALRIMKLGEKYHLPVITFIDTPGAYPGLGAEERGQAEAIAKNIFEMAGLKVPSISIVIGEGGSGGALAIGVTNRILMLQYSIYSVISPEGCASILYRDSTKSEEAANAMKITANYLKEFGIVDEIVKEPLGGAHRDYETTMQTVKEAITRNLKELMKIPSRSLIESRADKFYKIGFFTE